MFRESRGRPGSRRTRTLPPRHPLLIISHSFGSKNNNKKNTTAQSCVTTQLSQLMPSKTTVPFVRRRGLETRRGGPIHRPLCSGGESQQTLALHFFKPHCGRSMARDTTFLSAAWKVPVQLRGKLLSSRLPSCLEKPFNVS